MEKFNPRKRNESDVFRPYLPGPMGPPGDVGRGSGNHRPPAAHAPFYNPCWIRQPLVPVAPVQKITPDPPTFCLPTSTVSGSRKRKCSSPQQVRPSKTSFTGEDPMVEETPPNIFPFPEVTPRDDYRRVVTGCAELKPQTQGISPKSGSSLDRCVPPISRPSTPWSPPLTLDPEEDSPLNSTSMYPAPMDSTPASGSISSVSPNQSLEMLPPISSLMTDVASPMDSTEVLPLTFKPPYPAPVGPSFSSGLVFSPPPEPSLDIFPTRFRHQHALEARNPSPAPYRCTTPLVAPLMVPPLRGAQGMNQQNLQQVQNTTGFMNQNSQQIQTSTGFPYSRSPLINFDHFYDAIRGPVQATSFPNIPPLNITHVTPGVTPSPPPPAHQSWAQMRPGAHLLPRPTTVMSPMPKLKSSQQLYQPQMTEPAGQRNLSPQHLNHQVAPVEGQLKRATPENLPKIASFIDQDQVPPPIHNTTAIKPPSFELPAIEPSLTDPNPMAHLSVQIPIQQMTDFVQEFNLPGIEIDLNN